MPPISTPLAVQLRIAKPRYKRSHHLDEQQHRVIRNDTMRFEHLFREVRRDQSRDREEDRAQCHQSSCVHVRTCQSSSCNSIRASDRTISMAEIVSFAFPMTSEIRANSSRSCAVLIFVKNRQESADITTTSIHPVAGFPCPVKSLRR